MHACRYMKGTDDTEFVVGYLVASCMRLVAVASSHPAACPCSYPSGAAHPFVLTMLGALHEVHVFSFLSFFLCVAGSDDDDSEYGGEGLSSWVYAVRRSGCLGF